MAKGLGNMRSAFEAHGGPFKPELRPSREARSRSAFSNGQTGRMPRVASVPPGTCQPGQPAWPGEVPSRLAIRMSNVSSTVASRPHGPFQGAHRPRNREARLPRQELPSEAPGRAKRDLALCRDEGKRLLREVAS